MSHSTLSRDPTSAGRTSVGELLRLAALAMGSSVSLVVAFRSSQGAWVAWVALVPFAFLLSSRRRTLDVCVGTWLAACLFHLAGAGWLADLGNHVALVRWAVLGILISVYWLGMLVVGRWICRRREVPMVLLLPAIWTAMEFCRARVGIVVQGGYPWLQLGQTQIGWLALAQLADLGGVSALTFVVAAVNGAVADILAAVGSHGKDRGLRAGVSAFVAAGLLAGALGYGRHRLSQDAARSGPRVAVIPSSLPRWGEGGVGLERRLAAMDDAGAAPDLFIWPETAASEPWRSSVSVGGSQAGGGSALNTQRSGMADGAAAAASPLAELARKAGSAVLAGVVRHELEGNATIAYNSAVAIERDGSVAGFHDKSYLVPWGEFIPLGLLQSLGETQQSLAAGRDPGAVSLRLGARGERVCVALPICYEICFPQMVRTAVRGAQADRAPAFIVNIGRESRAKSTYLPRVMLGLAQFRAIESRRSVVRCTEGGYSAIIDGNGRLLDLLPNENGGDTRWALVGRVPLDDRFSFYTYAGDWLAIGCCLMVVGLWVWPGRRAEAASAGGHAVGGVGGG